MRYVALLASIVIISLTALLTLKNTDPELYLRIALAADVIGISKGGQQEKSRLEKIDLLPISREKKDILVNRTIFLGATPNMVKLALGEPVSVGDEANNEGTQWVYHFDEDMMPTILEFKEDRLYSAHNQGNAP